MTTLERILVPLDGSSRSERALPMALALSQKFASQILLLRVPDAPGGMIATFLPEQGIRLQTEVRKHARREAESYLLARQGELRQQGFDVRVMIGTKSPAESIIETATAENVDLIVISSHGRGGLARWAYGSVADKVARHSPCPVLLVRENADEQPRG